MFKHHNNCRACSNKELTEILDLGISPLANDFNEAHEEFQGYAPLKLMWCPRCTLAQLSVVVTPDILYSYYPYVTSHSDTMMAHFKQLSSDLLKECEGRSVIEIGSNDGTFLKHCIDEGFITAIGIEPAKNLACIAQKNGINTHNRFFTDKLARELNNDGIVPDLIVARHVFCHIDDWHEVIHALGVLAGKNTLIAIEVPYLPDTIKKVEWDQIYHEHLSYLTVKSLEYILQGSMLHIHGVKHYPIHGGAIVVMLRRNDSEVQPKEIPSENLILNDLYAFRDKAENLILDLRDMVSKFVRDGKTVVGYGASAKATQWIQACGFTRKHLKWVCDSTPQKLWKMMPGTDIPVVDEGSVLRDLPDFCVLFSWNFRFEILKKNELAISKGVKFITPVPQIEIT